MLFDDTYKTVLSASEGVFRDKGSKFIAYVYPFPSESELKAIINNLRSLHPKANHYCWAFRLSPDRSVFRVNDDGEPAGTAGRPILNTLLSYDLTNVLVVVVRYFGGTLLGVPGLINAYRKATIEALNHSKIVQLTMKAVYEVSYCHTQMNDVMQILKEENIKVSSMAIDNLCTIRIEIRQASLERVLGRLKRIQEINLKFISTL